MPLSKLEATVIWEMRVYTTSGNVTDDVILQYIEQHGGKPTGVSR